MRRHFVALAAFLVKAHPPALAARVIVLDPHGNDGADASEKMAMSSGLGPSPTGCGKRLSFAAVQLIYIAALHRLDQQFAERPHQAPSDEFRAEYGTRA
jgi:hypothetical protein